eukprot:gene19206-22959_t
MRVLSADAKQATQHSSASIPESDVRIRGLDDIDTLCRELIRAGLEIRDRSWLFTQYPRCFLGSDLVKLLISLKVAKDVPSAVAVGNELISKHVFHHVWDYDIEMRDAYLFYRMSVHEEILGKRDLSSISHTFVLKTNERMNNPNTGVKLSEYQKGKYGYTGTAAAEWLEKEGIARSQEEANAFGDLLIAFRLITTVVKQEQRPFRNDATLYRPCVKSSKKAGQSSETKSDTLGVLRLDYGYPPIPGDIDHPNSFEYNVVYRKVKGLTFELAQSGEFKDDVEQNMLQAIRDLESLGAFGIT